MGLEIDPMSAASPDLSAAELRAMIESIRTDGQILPIVLYGGKVIDGRKRLAACEALGIEPKTVCVPDGTDPATWALALNLLRTHYSVGQRAIYAATVANLRKGQRPDGSKLISCSQAGKRFGVHASRVNQAQRIRRQGSPELVAAVERNAIRLNTADKISAMPKSEQAPMIAKAAEAKKAGVRMPAGTFKEKPKFKALPKKSALKVISNILDSMETTADLLSTYMTKPAENPPIQKWLKQVNGVRRILRRFHIQLKGGAHEASTQHGRADEGVDTDSTDGAASGRTARV